MPQVLEVPVNDSSRLASICPSIMRPQPVMWAGATSFLNSNYSSLAVVLSLQCVNPIGQILQPTLRVYIQPVEDEHGVFIRML